ncbi:MAG: hypothetical protein K1X44_05465 [Alphaproteobacteria bacterium]|nr:hypothetical protein [Alphaproteobacteria bacterium]
MKILSRIFKKSSSKNIAWDLYTKVVEQARHPVFYNKFFVPDTLDGRFELIILHIYTLMHQFKSRQNTKILNQELFDVLFQDMDYNLREMGAGDLGVGRRIKIMIQAFYGRIKAYDQAFSDSDPFHALRLAFTRNVYGTMDSIDQEIVDKMVLYIKEMKEFFSTIPTEDFLKGNFAFPNPEKHFPIIK